MFCRIPKLKKCRISGPSMVPVIYGNSEIGAYVRSIILRACATCSELPSNKYHGFTPNSNEGKPCHPGEPDVHPAEVEPALEGGQSGTPIIQVRAD